MSQTFANSINSNPIFAARSTADADGNNIASTYATQSTVSAIRQVPAASSSDQNKVLGVTDAQGTVGWVQGGGANTHTIVVDDVNPYGLPPKTMRVRFANSAYDPRNQLYSEEYECKQVSSSPNVWDITFISNLMIYNNISRDSSGGFDVLDANLYGVTSISGMFRDCQAVDSITILNVDGITDMSDLCTGCYYLTSITLPALHEVTTLTGAFYYNTQLTSINLSGLENVESMVNMFNSCTGLTAFPDWSNETFANLRYVDGIFSGDQFIQSGIYDMYEKLSSAPNISSYSDAFTNCGESGPAASELYSIPSSWGGYGS